MSALPATPGRKFNWRNAWLYLILLVVFLIIAFPIYWMLTISLKIPTLITSIVPPRLISDNCSNVGRLRKAAAR